MKDTLITPELLDRWNPCSDGKAWGLPIIGKGIKLSKLLPHFKRADWLLWLLRKVDALDKVQYVELAVICAQTVLYIFEKKYPKDKRPRQAIEAAIKYAKEPTEENRKAAAAAADAAAYAADAYAARLAFGQAREKELKAMCEIVRANLQIHAVKENAARGFSSRSRRAMISGAARRH